MEPVHPPATIKRAEGWASLNTRWDKRAKLAAEWLQTDRVVTDIGCGLMTLEAYLPNTTTYIPMDLVARDERTMVVDLSQDRIPAVSCDVAVMLGVLEYIDDLVPVFEQLHQFPRSVISYNHLSIHDLLWKVGLRAKLVDWQHRYSRAYFRRLLRSSGLQIMRERLVRIGEGLYEVKSATTGSMKSLNTQELC